MSTYIDSTLDSLESAAAEFASNWKEWPDFAWRNNADDVPDEEAHLWGIYHPAHRDSTAIDRCNAESIREALQDYIDSDPPTVVDTTFNHWAVGYVDAIIVRVYGDNGDITPAFSVFYDLMCRLQDYPVLDESKLSEMEYDEFLESWASWGRSDFVRGLDRLVQGWIADTYDAQESESDVERQLREAQELFCPHTGIPTLVCACGACHTVNPDDVQHRFDNLDRDAIDRLWYYCADRIGWEYSQDSGGCIINIDGALEYVSSMDTDDVWDILDGTAE